MNDGARTCETTVAEAMPPLPPLASDAQLREQGLLQILAHSMPDLIYVKDAECRYVFNNASHLSFLGAESAEDVWGKSVLDVFPIELGEKFYHDEKAILESGMPLINKEEETTDSQGRRLWVSTTKVPLFDEKGVPIGLAGISRDITDRKQAEESLRRAHAQLESEHAALVDAMRKLNVANDELAATQMQLAQVTRLHSIGAMAAGIAHEVKNPLAMIGIGLDYLAGRPETHDDGSERVFHTMRAALEHARRVMEGLLDFSRPGRLERRCLAIQTPIERALLLLRAEVVRRHVDVETDVAPDVPPISADCTKIEQVLINVLGNALQAMPGGGVLKVTATRESWGGPPRGELSPGERVVRVTVDDTGPGISDEHLGKIFEPFFTTKSPAEGTGLGLTIVRTIMGLHGGAIDIRNRPGGGVRVTLSFKEGIVEHGNGHEASIGR